MSTFGERLDQARVHANKTRADIARVLRSPDGTMGVTGQAVGQIIRGTGSLSAENCARAARFLGVDHYWLATGEGQMVPGITVAGESPAAYSSGPSTASTLEALGMLLAQAPRDKREAIAQTLAGWAKEGGADHWRVMLLAILASDTLGKRTGT